MCKILKQIEVGVIPAAGRGTRMGYLSSILPKCLFPLFDKPIIHSNVEKMIDLGIKTIHVIVHYQKDKIKEYLRSVQDSIDAEINFIEQKKLLGIANAIMLTKEYVDGPFMVMLGDDCTIVKSLQNLVDTFSENDAVAVEGIVKEKDYKILKSTCSVKVNKNKQITEIVEKPKDPPSNLRGCGIYLFQNVIYDYIKRTPVSNIRNEVEITDVVNLVAKTGSAFGEFIDGFNININSYLDLLIASNLVWEMKNTTPISPVILPEKRAVPFVPSQ